MNLLNSTRNDYNNIKNKVWPVVVREGNIEDTERSQVVNFIKNVKSLTASDNPSYKSLDAGSKQELSTWLSFARNLESQLPSIPRFRGNSNNNYYNNHQNNNNNSSDPYSQTF